MYFLDQIQEAGPAKCSVLYVIWIYNHTDPL